MSTFLLMRHGSPRSPRKSVVVADSRWLGNRVAQTGRAARSKERLLEEYTQTVRPRERSHTCSHKVLFFRCSTKSRSRRTEGDHPQTLFVTPRSLRHAEGLAQEHTSQRAGACVVAVSPFPPSFAPTLASTLTTSSSLTIAEPPSSATFANSEDEA